MVTADRGMSHDYHFDNLYLDMNGIIHPCTHPEHKPAPETEEEMFEAIFEYIDMLMDMVKPTKLLYMAVDGVAPRAKMNQQRSRRFRAIKESQEKRDEVTKVKQELRAQGIEFDDDDSGNKPHFDTNVITPGTQFMVNLSRALRAWIDKKLDVNYEEPERRDYFGNVIKPTVWSKDMVVILSDASVPGEGEHKIIDFIRKQKVQLDYDPNLSHCLCGADADLIMLGLATHELNFTILREEFVPNQPKPCEICGQCGHEMKGCQGKANVPEKDAAPIQTEPGFIYIRLNVLREYFAKECEDLDLERYIDDFVFLCFFVGNDFLPHLPSLEIREGAIDRLLNIYRTIMTGHKHPKPYLTENGFVSLEKIQSIFKQLGTMEDEIFSRRRTNELRFRERQKRQQQMDHNALSANWMQPRAVLGRGKAPSSSNVRQMATDLRSETNSKQRLAAMMESDTSNDAAKKKRTATDVESAKSGDSDDEDEVQLWNTGFKDRYYLSKFNCVDHSEFSTVVASEYARGLCWVLRYYYQGCVDWQWFYPFHYAPFASDFAGIGRMKIEFKRDAEPFRPLEQLMSVFPAGSCQNLPPTWQKLMKESDSPIIDFYPNDFRIDLNGKRAAWQGVALLPFIDETRLFLALKQVYNDLTDPEMERNSLGPHLVFVSRGWSAPTESLQKLIKASDSSSKGQPMPGELHGFKGELRRSERYSDEYGNSFCFEYYDPTYEQNFVFPAVRLAAAKPPPTVLKPEDFANSNSNYRGQNSYGNNNYRPTIGFSQRNDRAQLSNYGHRSIDAHVRSNQSHLHHNRPQHESSYASNSYRSDVGGGNSSSGSYNPYAGGAYNYDTQPSGYSSGRPAYAAPNQYYGGAPHYASNASYRANNGKHASRGYSNGQSNTYHDSRRYGNQGATQQHSHHSNRANHHGRAPPAASMGSSSQADSRAAGSVPYQAPYDFYASYVRRK